MAGRRKRGTEAAVTFCQSNREILPGQQRRSLTKELDRRPVFIVRFPPLTHQVSPLSYFCGPLQNSSPLWPIGSRYPLPALCIQSSGQSTSQSKFGKAAQRVLLGSIPPSSLAPGLTLFRGPARACPEALVKTQELDARGTWPSCQRTGQLVAPPWQAWLQHHSAISISFRLGQTKTLVLLPVPSGQVRSGQACTLARPAVSLPLPCPAVPRLPAALHMLNAVIRGASR